MCGISGMFSRYNQKYNMLVAIENMTNSMIHRGPDDKGICPVYFKENHYSFKNMVDDVKPIGCLGFNRLSIRDLSINGHQPMISLEKDVVIVFNGEIYNAEELKEEYLFGYTFRGASDTEVILNLYKKLGMEKTISLLDGMFAFCIVDTRKGKFYLGRDRVGIKPLYYYKNNDIFIFSSELKAILEARVFEPQPDKVAFYEMMMFRFNHKRTLIDGILQFEPGCFAEADLINPCHLSVKRYWSPEQEFVVKKKEHYDFYKNQIKNVLENNVKKQMVSDVDVGCELSGGIDSSLITYFFSLNKKIVKNSDKIRNISFGIIPESKNLSEEKYMDYVSLKTGVEIDKILVNNDYVADNWKRMVWYLDTIPSFVNEIGISALAKESRKSKVTVLMSGEGSDEVFGGYDYIASGGFILNVYNATRFLGNTPKRFLQNRKIADSSFKGKLDEEYYLLWSADGNWNDLVKKLCPEFDKHFELACKDRKDTITRVSQVSGMSLFDKSRCYDLACRVTALCNRQDKMTMESSIENRVPFLSNEVISCGLKVPKKYLCKWKKKITKQGKNPFIRQGKYILKDIVKDIYGDKFAFRIKMGFPLPLEDFINRVVESDDFSVMLKKLENRNIVNMVVVKDWCDKLYNQKGYYSGEVRMLWNLFSYEYFCEQFIDRYNACARDTHW